jgi:hypothetical protein
MQNDVGIKLRMQSKNLFRLLLQQYFETKNGFGWVFYSLFFLVIITANGFASTELVRKDFFPVLSHLDMIPFQWQEVERVVAVGDVHGDLNALLKILYKKNLVDREGHWVGRDAHLVMIGDLINGGSGSLDVLDYLMELEKEVDFWGGKLHVLLGNHELRLLFGDVDALSHENLENLAREYYPSKVEMKNKVLRDFYYKSGRYFSWLSKKNLMEIINGVAFVHAGLNPLWFLHKNQEEIFGQINTTARMLIAKGRRFNAIDSRYYWTVGLHWNERVQDFSFAGDLGPAWDRGFGTREFRGEGQHVIPSWNKSVRLNEFRNMMGDLGLHKMVVGHNPVRSGTLYLNHPYWGKLVTVIDTKISEAFDGQLTAFEMDLAKHNNNAYGLDFFGETFKRPKKEKRLDRVLLEMQHNKIGNKYLLQRCENLRF